MVYAHSHLQPQIAGRGGQRVLQVVQHMLGFAQRAQRRRAHGLELVVRHGNDDGVVGAGGDDAGVELVDEVGGFGGGARGHFPDAGEAVLSVAGVDALGGVDHPDDEPGVELGLQAGLESVAGGHWTGPVVQAFLEGRVDEAKPCAHSVAQGTCHLDQVARFRLGRVHQAGILRGIALGVIAHERRPFRSGRGDRMRKGRKHDHAVPESSAGTVSMCTQGDQVFKRLHSVTSGVLRRR